MLQEQLEHHDAAMKMSDDRLRTALQAKFDEVGAECLGALCPCVKGIGTRRGSPRGGEGRERGGVTDKTESEAGRAAK